MSIFNNISWGVSNVNKPQRMAEDLTEFQRIFSRAIRIGCSDFVLDWDRIVVYCDEEYIPSVHASWPTTLRDLKNAGGTQRILANRLGPNGLDCFSRDDTIPASAVEIPNLPGHVCYVMTRTQVIDSTCTLMDFKKNELTVLHKRNEPYTIGRPSSNGRQNDIPIVGDDSISRSQGRIICYQTEWYYIPESSNCGTWVDGNYVSGKTKLSGEGRISFSRNENTRLHYSIKQKTE